MKDNTLKLEPFHHDVLCWHVKPLQELFLLTGYSCKGPPYDLLTMSPLGPSFPCILAFWAFISFHFGLLGLHFLLFWPFGPSFPCILAFWACICFYFGLLGLHFLSFWPFGPDKNLSGQDLAQNCDFPFKFCNFSFSKICLLRLHFLSFWPFGPSFPFILAF